MFNELNIITYWQKNFRFSIFDLRLALFHAKKQRIALPLQGVFSCSYDDSLCPVIIFPLTNALMVVGENSNNGSPITDYRIHFPRGCAAHRGKHFEEILEAKLIKYYDLRISTHDF